LQSVTTERDGKVEVQGSVLVPHPEEGWIVTLAFQKAHQEGLGQTRLARFLNAHPDIPQKFKDFLPSTVGTWLKNRIYKGVLQYGEFCTDIVDDTRVKQRNADEDVLLIADFCPPLIPVEVWEAVNAVRQARAEQRGAARRLQDDAGGKLIAPPAPGLALKFLLTGLVRCGECQRAMTPSSGPTYVSKAGVAKRYTAYVCPGYLARICPNSTHVPEGWLRQEVLRLLCERFGLEPEGGAAS
jgi:hypothetical protein